MTIRKSQRGSIAARAREQAKRECRMEEYRAAFRLANDCDPPRIAFAHGWYYVRRSGGWIAYRGTEIDEMTAELTRRKVGN